MESSLEREIQCLGPLIRWALQRVCYNKDIEICDIYAPVNCVVIIGSDND